MEAICCKLLSSIFFLVYVYLVHKLQKKKNSCAKKGVCYSDVLDITTSCCYSIITIQRLSLPAQLTLLPGSDLSSFRGFYCSAQLHVRSESSTCFQERIRGFLEKIQFLQTTGSYFSNRCL